MKMNNSFKSIATVLVMGLLVTNTYGQKENKDEYKEILSKYNTDIPTKILTPDVVETERLGTLNFYDGMPTEETVQKVYDNLDFMRGVDVFLNFIPMASVESMRTGLADIGATDYNKVALFEDLLDSRALFLTGNSTTVYAVSFIDMKKDGAMVIEIPPGAGPGTLDDAFFRFVVDMGAPGPDRKKGGTYVILPPDYEGDLEVTPNTFKDNHSVKAMVRGEERNVWIAQSRSYSNWVVLRGFLVDGKPDGATKMWKEGLKIYPLDKARERKEMEFINISGKEFNTIHANNFSFYEEIAVVIEREPLEFLDPELRGQLAAIGIIKGQPFAPDARMKKILTESVKVGNATARAVSLLPRNPAAYMYEDNYWYAGFIGDDYRWLDLDGHRGRNMDARTAFFYSATVNTPAMALKIPGIGSNYAFGTRDNDGNILKGANNYKLHIEANVPAKDFWSVVVYDPQTRSELQTDNLFPNKNNKRDKLVYNKDGSVDLYFGPKPPSKKLEINWIQTVPGKAWFTLFRLYGPLEPWFEKTWQLNDFELIK